MKHRVIAITGSIATGKSTVIEIIRQKGYQVLDADKIAHDLMARGQVNYKAIVDYFGPYILGEDKEIDRKKLGELVFNDKKKLESLNQLTHGNIFFEIEKRLEESESRIVFLELPLLFELKADDKLDMTFDEIWLVYVNEKIQEERLIKRNRLDRDEAKKLIASQLSIEKKKEEADFIIYNDGSKEKTREQIEKRLGELI